MAYCRENENSDLYMYHCSTHNNYQFIISKHNSLGKEPIHFSVDTAEKALHRLQRLKSQGFKITDDTIERLKEEINEKNILL
jgi:hypothetical protein